MESLSYQCLRNSDLPSVTSPELLSFEKISLHRKGLSFPRTLCRRHRYSCRSSVNFIGQNSPPPRNWSQSLSLHFSFYSRGVSPLTEEGPLSRTKRVQFRDTETLVSPEVERKTPNETWFHSKGSVIDRHSILECCNLGRVIISGVPKKRRSFKALDTYK